MFLKLSDQYSFPSYLLNLTGQHIGYHSLQDQCCRIISSLLDAVENNTSQEIISALGEQLQVPVLPIGYFLFCFIILYVLTNKCTTVAVFGVKISGVLLLIQC